MEPRFTKGIRLNRHVQGRVHGHKLGERFLKIVFDTRCVPPSMGSTSPHLGNTAGMIMILPTGGLGFVEFGTKGNDGESLGARPRRPWTENPRKTFPYVSRKARKFIVAIYPEYHTELLPDSILKTEKPQNYEDDKPHRNALSKVYISRSIERGLHPGDLIVFYRTADKGAAYHTSVATSIGVVQGVIDGIPDLPTFIAACRKRSVFTDAQLKEFWDFKPQWRPFVLNFLFVYSLPKRPNLKVLQENDIIKVAPRGFDRMRDDAFERLLKVSNAKTSFVVG